MSSLMYKNNPPTAITWKWCSFNELSKAELYAVLKLRQEIFVVEQECVYLDCDGLDKKAWHLMGVHSNTTHFELVAYLRIIFPEEKTGITAIGRLLTHKKVRQKGAGRELLKQGIIHTEKAYPGSPIQVSAQLYLEQFYNSFGFVTVSEPYDEDGIAHIDMIKSI